MLAVEMFHMHWDSKNYACKCLWEFLQYAGYPEWARRWRQSTDSGWWYECLHRRWSMLAQAKTIACTLSWEPIRCKRNSIPWLSSWLQWRLMQWLLHIHFGKLVHWKNHACVKDCIKECIIGRAKHALRSAYSVTSRYQHRKWTDLWRRIPSLHRRGQDLYRLRCKWWMCEDKWWMCDLLFSSHRHGARACMFVLALFICFGDAMHIGLLC